jgi:hypothetical protein
VGGTGSVFCTLANFDISGFERLGSANTLLIRFS